MQSIRFWRVVSVCFIAFSMIPATVPRALALPAPNVVLLSDFGKKDGAVAALYGVIDQVNPSIKISDLTHDIPRWDISSAAYRLGQVSRIWRAGTVFVSVVDPGVGTDRRSIVVRTALDHYFVTPDNGTLTHVDQLEKVTEVRVIDPRHRLPGSEGSHTFHGRDVYAYVAARLAAGQISFEEVGETLPVSQLVRLTERPAEIEGDVLRGVIPALDVQFGNVWSNIPESLAERFGLHLGESYDVRILHAGREIYSRRLPYRRTFGEVNPQDHLLYVNSLGKLACGIFLSDLAAESQIAYGPQWTFEVRK